MSRFGLRGPVALLACLAGSCFATFAAFADDELLQQRLRAHIEFLASDELAGREPGTAGYDIAARYVASQFQQIGLQPAGTDSSWFQPVPLRSATMIRGTPAMVLHRDGQQRGFRFVSEFFMSPEKGSSAVDITAPMVFAGYGIHAPPLDYSDFESIDVSGKIVVTLGGQPLDFPSEEGAHFGSNREKALAIASRGAVGWISVYTPRSERRYDWSRVRSRVGKASMSWLHEDGTVSTAYGQLESGASIHYQPAGVLFEGSSHDLGSLIEMDESGQGLPVFDLVGEMNIRQRSRHHLLHSPNVVGMLPGTDPLLSREYLVYLAHLDHIGELAHDREDPINNGALDNASGISVMIETARLFADSGGARRSVLFLAVTAEEKGLVGSEYFAHYPTVPIERIVAAINLDMPVLLYEFADVIAFGAEHSSLEAPVREAAADYGIALTPDPFPAQNIFVRSDHYRFVQQGVPSIFLVTGTRALDSDEDMLPVYQGFLQEHYHRPSDDLNLPISYTAAARFTRINARIGELVAGRPERPSWHEGDFFGDTFGR